MKWTPIRTSRQFFVALGCFRTRGFFHQSDDAAKGVASLQRGECLLDEFDTGELSAAQLLAQFANGHFSGSGEKPLPSGRGSVPAFFTSLVPNTTAGSTSGDSR